VTGLNFILSIISWWWCATTFSLNINIYKFLLIDIELRKIFVEVILVHHKEHIYHAEYKRFSYVCRIMWHQLLNIYLII